jgi:hypothetical protein
VTAPERRELLEKFYRRARPLGNWRPFQDASDPVRGRILPGVAVALSGAAAVMAYIVAISCFYVARTAAGVVLLAVMVVCGIAFWRGFDPYVRSLLLPQERTELEDAEQKPAATAFDLFGMAGIGATIAFVLACVLAANALLFTRGPTTLGNGAAAVACGVAGVWLRRRQKAGELG